jgi:hypothetical protein
LAKVDWVEKPSDKPKSHFDRNRIEVIIFHSSPLNIACSAIFALVENVVETVTLCEIPTPLSGRQYFDIYNDIGKIVRESMNDIFPIDSRDYILARCHFNT